MKRKHLSKFLLVIFIFTISSCSPEEDLGSSEDEEFYPYQLVYITEMVWLNAMINENAATPYHKMLFEEYLFRVYLANLEVFHEFIEDDYVSEGLSMLQNPSSQDPLQISSWYERGIKASKRMNYIVLTFVNRDISIIAIKVGSHVSNDFSDLQSYQDEVSKYNRLKQNAVQSK